MTSKNKILFITTKNIDYIRNVQEIKLLKEHNNDVDVLYSNGKNYLIRIIEIYFRLLFKSSKKYSEVFVGFAPQLILPVFYWKFKNAVVTIDFFISMYDTLVHDRKVVKDKGIIANILHKVDTITLKKANKIISDTKAHAKYFVHEFGVYSNKIKTIYLDADTSIYYPKTVRKSGDVEGKFLVLYFGSVLPLQGVDIVMGAIANLKNRNDIFFYIIGPVGKKIDKVNSSNVKYFDWLPQEDLADKIAEADLCLGGHFSSQIEKANRTIPGKAYIYKAMKKPIILGDTDANHELFTENNKDIFFVKTGSSAELSNKIIFIKEG